MIYKIISIEDSPEIQNLVKIALSNAPFELSFAYTLKEGRDYINKGKADAILLDIDLPDGDGLKFYSEIKNYPELASIPVFILTGRNSIEDKSLGFQLGIEDFITKPFNPIELKLRLETRLKKILDKKVGEEIIHLGNLTIDLASQRVIIQNQTNTSKPDLSSTEFKILYYLAKNKEQIKSRDQIMTTVWGEDTNFTDRTIDSHISRLRKKIAECNYKIEAVANSGYRLTAKDV